MAASVTASLSDKNNAASHPPGLGRSPHPGDELARTRCRVITRRAVQAGPWHDVSEPA